MCRLPKRRVPINCWKEAYLNKFCELDWHGASESWKMFLKWDTVLSIRVPNQMEAWITAVSNWSYRRYSPAFLSQTYFLRDSKAWRCCAGKAKSGDNVLARMHHTNPPSIMQPCASSASRCKTINFFRWWRIRLTWSMMKSASLQILSALASDLAKHGKANMHANDQIETSTLGFFGWGYFNVASIIVVCVSSCGNMRPRFVYTVALIIADVWCLIIIAQHGITSLALIRTSRSTLIVFYGNGWQR